jgi:hypothetical protein
MLAGGLWPGGTQGFNRGIYPPKKTEAFKQDFCPEGTIECRDGFETRPGQAQGPAPTGQSSAECYGVQQKDMGTCSGLRLGNERKILDRICETLH